MLRDDCRDAGGRAPQEAEAEYALRPELPSRVRFPAYTVYPLSPPCRKRIEVAYKLDIVGQFSAVALIPLKQ
jgi:hypothetical protein